MGTPETKYRRAARELTMVRGASVYGALHWSSTAPPCKTVTFSSGARWDSDGFFMTGHPSRITIPADLEGRYLASAFVMWSRDNSNPFTIGQRDGTGSTSAAGYFSAVITANGSTTSPRQNLSVAAVVPTAIRTTQVVSWETDLAAGDYLEVELCQNVIGVDPGIAPADDTLISEVDFTIRRLGISA